jgi:transposase
LNVEYNGLMSPTRTYFPATTPQQRKLLFETWQATGSVVQACRTAHVGRGTFYHWKPRFEADSYAGLVAYAKKGPAPGTGRVSADIERRVLALHHEHPDWGKHRLATEMAKANSWVPLVSPNTVRRLLAEAGLWSAEAPRLKKTPFNPARARRTFPARR